MRILHVVASPHLGGAERYGVLLAEAQRQAGHDSMVLMLADGDAKPYAEARQVPYMLKPIDTSLPRKQRWRQGAEQLAAAATEFKADIVHSHVPLSHLLCHRALPKLKIPWVATLHGSWRAFGYAPSVGGRRLRSSFAKLRHALGDRYATSSAARIIAVSEYTRREYKQLAIADSKLRTIINGFPFSAAELSQAEARQKYEISDDTLAIGTVGYLVPQKGFDLLVEAFALIATDFPKAKLYIAGGDVLELDDYRKMLQKRITELNLSDRVRLLGTVDIRQGFLRALDIFALPSRTEGLPATLVEAMQHGLPSVISSAGGSQEAARPDKECLMFSSEDIHDLATKLKALLESSALRKKLGSAAYARAVSAFSIERCAAEYLQMYEEVIAEQTS